MLCLNSCVLNTGTAGRCGPWQGETSRTYEKAKYDGDYRGAPLSLPRSSSGSSAYGDITAGLRL